MSVFKRRLKRVFKILFWNPAVAVVALMLVASCFVVSSASLFGFWGFIVSMVLTVVFMVFGGAWMWVLEEEKIAIEDERHETIHKIAKDMVRMKK